MNDNQPAAKPQRDSDDRRVFRVPIVLTVTADLFVLAPDLTEARRQAKLADANDYFDFNPETIWIPDGEDTERLRFTDVVVSVVDLSGIIPDQSRKPNDHPDFIILPKR